jgi:hypothetical protein
MVGLENWLIGSIDGWLGYAASSRQRDLRLHNECSNYTEKTLHTKELTALDKIDYSS